MRIFLSPAAMDVVVFLVMFAVSYGAGERHMNTGQIAWLGGVMQVTYMAASLAAGWVLNRRNARAILLASVAACVGASVLALELVSFRPLLVAMGLLGVSAAFFFNAFQTFMRGEAPPGGLARATALYTASWSGGASAGFLASGLFYQLGPLFLALVTVTLGAGVWLLLARHRRRPGHEPSADEHVEVAPDADPKLHDAYVGVAWVMIFTAMFVQRPLQTFFPALSGRTGLSPILAGAPLFAHMFLQAVCGGFMARARGWLYRPGPLAAIQLAAACLLAWLWLFPAYRFTAPGIGLLGAWAGFMYFFAVFYASNAGHRSRNIGINECLVGLGSFSGLFVSEWFMARFHDEAMYAVCAGAILLAVAVQMVLIRFRGGRRAEVGGQRSEVGGRRAEG